MGPVCLLFIFYLACYYQFSICEFVNLDKPQFSVNYGTPLAGTGITTKIIIYCRANLSPSVSSLLDVCICCLYHDLCELDEFFAAFSVPVLL